ncbi:hypothetical protein V7x_55670 [Crateriforma conspicua]|uniref:Uncharacterized protein n=1 Tax=Crateriforma conspicua TaxID=2527996 RepID=A0A5C6FIS0_9PLAN|nr:hypothetical protein [Crateriforma conspicua]TWU59551.1 hypothetical protein V7x_55670 [Crateriforma conspicua]
MFSEEDVCYECNCTVVDGRDCLEVATWVYLGYFKMNCNSTDCDVPNHFYRFVKFDDFHRWKQNQDTELPCVNLTSMAQVRQRFVDRQAMVDSVLDWHNYLTDNSTAE